MFQLVGLLWITDSKIRGNFPLSFEYLLYANSATFPIRGYRCICYTFYAANSALLGWSKDIDNDLLNKFVNIISYEVVITGVSVDTYSNRISPNELILGVNIVVKIKCFYKSSIDSLMAVIQDRKYLLLLWGWKY